jgi:hypothetical protein
MSDKTSPTIEPTKEERHALQTIIDATLNLTDDQRQRVLIAVAAICNIAPNEPIESRRLRLFRKV